MFQRSDRLKMSIHQIRNSFFVEKHGEELICSVTYGTIN